MPSVLPISLPPRARSRSRATRSFAAHNSAMAASPSVCDNWVLSTTLVRRRARTSFMRAGAGDGPCAEDSSFQGLLLGPSGVGGSKLGVARLQPGSSVDALIALAKTIGSSRWRTTVYGPIAAFPPVGFRPYADIIGPYERSFTIPVTGENPLVDHLVGTQHDRPRDREAQRVRGFHVEHQLETRRLFDGEIAGLGAPEDSIDVVSDPAKRFV